MGIQHVHGGPGFKRCSHPLCRAVRAEWRRQDRAKKAVERLEDPATGVPIHPLAPHGTATGYQDWACRCLVVPGTEDDERPTPGCTPVGLAEAKRLRDLNSLGIPHQRDAEMTLPRGIPLMNASSAIHPGTILAVVVILFVLVNCIGLAWSHPEAALALGRRLRRTGTTLMVPPVDPALDVSPLAVIDPGEGQPGPAAEELEPVTGPMLAAVHLDAPDSTRPRPYVSRGRHWRSDVEQTGVFAAVPANA